MSATGSRLVAIELLNIMSITQARFEFDESGILNLAGYNDSGKSAVTRALEIVFYDAYSTDQVNFIQDGKEYSGIGLEFSDGISINKYKYATGKSVWEMLKGSEVLFTNQLANGVAAMQGVPEPIAEYLGVVKDEATDEQLNVRRNTDQMFLIQTTGGVNYKIINSILRCDVLSKTVALLNEDRNKLQSEVVNLGTSARTLRIELENMQVIEPSMLSAVEDSTAILASLRTRYQYVTEVRTQKDLLDDFVIYDELTPVDLGRYRELQAIRGMSETLSEPVAPECTSVDLARYQALLQVKELRSALSMPVPPEVQPLSLERYRALVDLKNLQHAAMVAESTLKATQQEHESVISELSSLSTQYGFKICKNCGTVAV